MQRNQKIKILQVHNYYQIPGGEDTVVNNEKKLLEDNGHTVIQYTRHNNELNEFPKYKKLLLPFLAIFNPKTYFDIKMIVKKESIDVIHVHNPLTLISPAVFYAAVSCGVPVVQTIHNFRMICPGATFYRDGNICEECVEKGLKCAMKHKCYRGSFWQTLLCVLNTKIHRLTGIYKKVNFICLTEFNQKKLLLLNKGNKKIIDESKVYIKPNFTFESKIKRKKGGDFYLFIGRVEQIKGIDLLLKAFSLIPNKKLKLAGTGIDLDFYKKLATPNIEFLGFLNREVLAEQISLSKAVIVSSQCYETFGMIIVEAYSACCPVIVGDIGNITSLVEDGETGIKFSYNEATSLVKAIQRFEESASMEENGFKKFQEEFSPEANYKKLNEIYESIKSR